MATETTTLNFVRSAKSYYETAAKLGESPEEYTQRMRADGIEPLDELPKLPRATIKNRSVPIYMPHEAGHGIAGYAVRKLWHHIPNPSIVIKHNTEEEDASYTSHAEVFCRPFLFGPIASVPTIDDDTTWFNIFRKAEAAGISDEDVNLFVFHHMIQRVAGPVAEAMYAPGGVTPNDVFGMAHGQGDLDSAAAIYMAWRPADVVPGDDLMKVPEFNNMIGEAIKTAEGMLSGARRLIADLSLAFPKAGTELDVTDKIAAAFDPVQSPRPNKGAIWKSSHRKEKDGTSSYWLIGAALLQPRKRQHGGRAGVPVNRCLCSENTRAHSRITSAH